MDLMINEEEFCREPEKELQQHQQLSSAVQARENEIDININQP